jgi:hypothetical protein
MSIGVSVRATKIEARNRGNQQVDIVTKVGGNLKSDEQ